MRWRKAQGKVVAVNKKANHDFAIEETIEAGIVLQGTEIKSIRNGKVQLTRCVRPYSK